MGETVRRDATRRCGSARRWESADLVARPSGRAGKSSPDAADVEMGKPADESDGASGGHVRAVDVEGRARPTIAPDDEPLASVPDHAWCRLLARRGGDRYGGRGWPSTEVHRSGDMEAGLVEGGAVLVVARDENVGASSIPGHAVAQTVSDPVQVDAGPLGRRLASGIGPHSHEPSALAQRRGRRPAPHSSRPPTVEDHRKLQVPTTPSWTRSQERRAMTVTRDRRGRFREIPSSPHSSNEEADTTSVTNAACDGNPYAAPVLGRAVDARRDR